MSYQLPENFFFGGAMSGPQTEGKWQDGGKLPNLWDTWSNLDIHAFHNRVGSYAGNDFTERMEDDLQLLRSLGMDSIRTSIQWSRLLDINATLIQRARSTITTFLLLLRRLVLRFCKPLPL